MALKLDSNLIKRTITALALAPLTLYFLWAFPNKAHWLFIGLLFLSIYEIIDISRQSSRSLSIKLLTGLPAVCYVFLGLLGFYLVYICTLNAKIPGFIFLVAIIWATDIGAYFVGRKIGGPKLWPKVSPKKTWSGAIGGLFFATAITIILHLWDSLPSSSSTFEIMLLGTGLSIIAQVGDLLESAYKRFLGVKDSGGLLPGHGGFLDRLDSLYLCGLFTLIFMSLFYPNNLLDAILQGKNFLFQ